MQSPNHRYDEHLNSGQLSNKKNLDNIYVESFQKPRGATPYK